MKSKPPKGRGAQSRRTGRFERLTLVREEELERDTLEREEKLVRFVTDVKPERIRSILTRNDSPDIPFDRSINPYRGCEHGCIYCFARPTHAYLGLSPGLDFETKIFSKPEAPQVLRRELSKPGYQCDVVALGANTDPYQPVERKLKITRGILEVLSEFRHPVTIVTKSNLVLRDLDLLKEMAKENLARVNLSITTLSDDLARRMEPRAARPALRLEALRTLSSEEIPVGVLASPMIPALNDSELEAILQAAAESGARWANYILVRLPLEIKELFEEWLDAHYPDKKKHVFSLIRQARGGKLYSSEWGKRMRGEGAYAKLLEQRFDVACKRYGLVGSAPLTTTRFRAPSPKGSAQLGLFAP